jgi:hypothetical protein
MKPHSTDGLSLTFGLVFLAAAGLWLLARLVTLRPATVGWLIVSGLVVLGGIGIAHAATRAGRRGDDTDDQPG